MAVQPPRPGSTPLVPARPAAPGAARAAAQKAFFEAALNKAGAPVAATAPTAQARTTAIKPAITRLRAERIDPEPPNRTLRPGSLLDIKV